MVALSSSPCLLCLGLRGPFFLAKIIYARLQAHTNDAVLQVYFADPQLNITVKCHDANPPDAFPSMRNQSYSSASLVSPSTNVTCLLTAMPTPSHHSSHIRLHRGINLVTLCLVMTAPLVGSSLFSSPPWLEGTEILLEFKLLMALLTSQTFIASKSGCRTKH